MNRVPNRPSFCPEHRESLDRHLGQLANRIRLAGFVVASIAVAAKIGTLASPEVLGGALSWFFPIIASAGFGAAIAGEIFWRTLLRLTSVDSSDF